MDKQPTTGRLLEVILARNDSVESRMARMEDRLAVRIDGLEPSRRGGNR